MPALVITPLMVASHLIGIAEVPGDADSPHVVAWLEFVMREAGIRRPPAIHDEIPNCSAFVGYVVALCGLPRPALHEDREIRQLALRARSWLTVGRAIPPAEFQPGYDVIVFNRAGGPVDVAQINAPGHVAFPIGADGPRIQVLGANQSNRVSKAFYPAADILGVRRLWEVV